MTHMTGRYRAVSGSSTIDADVRTDGTIAIDDTLFTVIRLADGRVEVASGDGRRVEVTLASDVRGIWVGARGRSASVTVTATIPGRASAAAAASPDMTAPMPATVVTIAAPAGTVVAKGDPVVIVEAMKMTVTVRAPRQGVVKVVRCRVGDIVRAGAVLAELDT